MNEEIYRQHEPSAQEIATTAFGRANADKIIPKELHEVVYRLMVDTAFDSIEFGEAIASLPNNDPTPFEIYLRGYNDGIDDFGEDK